MRLRRFSITVAAAVATAGLCVPISATAAGAAASALVTLRLTGLNRASKVVAVPSATMLNLSTTNTYFYQGSSLQVLPGTYLIAAEVPAYSGKNTVSETLVFRQVQIGRSQTLRLDGKDGRRLSVTLAGVKANVQTLSATVCLSDSSGGQVVLAGSAFGGPGTTVYAVPATSHYITFGYSDILTSPTGGGSYATYYLTGSTKGKIPARMTYTQRASRLARLVAALRSGVYGSSEFDWSIQSGASGSVCGAGQSYNITGFPRGLSLVNYMTPGTWSTSVIAYSQGRGGTLYQDAALYDTGNYRAGGRYTNIFGGAVAGPGPGFPESSANYQSPSSPYTLLSYQPYLFATPAGGADCCYRSTVTLRHGGRVQKTARIGTRGLFTATIRQAGWYTLDATSNRSFPDGPTPRNLLSPTVSVSFRFHAAARPAGNGSYQNLPLTDTYYQALGLNNSNQAPASSVTKLDITVTRPSDDGVATPVYRIKSVAVYASSNGGKTWQLLKLRALRGYWQASIHDPAAGFVAIRSVVKDVHGDSTEQTVYRAYAIAG